MICNQCECGIDQAVIARLWSKKTKRTFGVTNIFDVPAKIKEASADDLRAAAERLETTPETLTSLAAHIMASYNLACDAAAGTGPFAHVEHL